MQATRMFFLDRIKMTVKRDRPEGGVTHLNEVCVRRTGWICVRR